MKLEYTVNNEHIANVFRNGFIWVKKDENQRNENVANSVNGKA